ncbi:MAG: F0F1 ATP synthase subunit alpha [Candidatus Omnitrophica bacterium]|nr:F0F1 ATP synthase subunit alpha [Candidatus Omnitrophota bacterium]
MSDPTVLPTQTTDPAAKTSPSFEIREVGTVKSVRELIARAVGLPSCMNGQMVEFANGARGMVMGFTEHEVQILTFGGKGRIRAGDEIYNRGEEFRVPVGEAFVGRIVNALCEPVDGREPVDAAETHMVFAEAPGVMERIPVDQTMETGTQILDAVIPIAKGQRQLIIGDRMTGKTTLGLDAILNQAGKNVLCLYCCTGKTYSSLMKVVRLFQARGAMDYTTVVAAPASTPVGEQYLSPYTACALGEYFTRRGRDVLLVFDDLTKHAWIYRQLSLLLDRAPGREAYPGDIFYIHSQLLERAGYFSKELGGGSMTFLPICDILQGDVTGYVPSNLVSMTDGQIYLGTELFNKGIRPAIDFGLSVSRIGSKAQWPAMKELSGRLRLEYVQYQELLQMTQLRTSLSSEAEARLKRGETITALLLQDKNQPVAMEEQILHLYALRKGLLDALSLDQVKQFKREFHKAMQEWFPEFDRDLRGVKQLTPEIRRVLDEGLRRYLHGFGAAGAS